MRNSDAKSSAPKITMKIRRMMLVAESSVFTESGAVLTSSTPGWLANR